MEGKGTYIAIAIVAIVVFIAIVVVIITDGNSNNKKENITNNTSNSTQQNTTSKTTDTFDYESAAEEQMSEAKEGEEIAIMHVKGYGDITFKFFKDKAPKAVENFLTHAKEGYYNGVKFHRVMEDFMIQGGDPKGDGTGGESIWGTGFEEEIDKSLVPYRGALCMASTGYGNSSLGSQFFIVQANADESMASSLKNYGYSQNLIDQYLKYGGYLSLYKQYTVFGQIVDGMDVVDKIAKVEKKVSSSGELSVPVEDVIIESIDVTTK